MSIDDTVARAEGVAWTGHGIALAGAQRDAVIDVLEHVRDAGGREDLPSPDEVVDFPSAHLALGASWEHVLAELTRAVGSGRSLEQAPRQLALLDQIKRVDHQLLEQRVRHRDAAFQKVREGLAMLRDAESTSALIDQATVAVCSLGFDRSIVSRIEDSAWIPERVWVERDPSWAEEILEIGRSNPQILDRTVVDTEMVRRKVGILVHNVQDRPAVHRAIAEASRSRSYTAAPLITRGSVVGLLHADCYHQRRNADEFDRGVLTMFAEGLGQALGRTVVLDRLASIRRGFDQVAGALTAARDDRVRLNAPSLRVWPTVEESLLSGDAGYSTSARPGQDDYQGHPGGRSPTGFDGSLTRREVEVLRLMAAGDTNARIARRLVISEGTVKSHVKHILRKLGAANRAEAVSRWLGMEHERGGARSARNGYPPRHDG